MGLYELEKEIETILSKLGNELTTMERGASTIAKAENAVTIMLESSRETAKAFEVAKERFQLMANRIQEVDFSRYFSDMEKTIADNVSASREITLKMDEAYQSLSSTLTLLSDLKTDVTAEIGETGKRVKDIETSLGQLERAIIDSCEKLTMLETHWSQTKIAERLDSLKQQSEKSELTLASALGAVNNELGSFHGEFTQLGFYQKFKDIEHAQVKLTSQIENVCKQQETISNQQGQLRSQLDNQNITIQKNQEEIKKILSDMQDGMKQKISIVLLLNGAIILGIITIAFLLHK